MKILYVITSLGVGGAERIVCDLADSMIEKGHQVEVVCLTGDILIKPNKANIHNLKLNSIFDFFSSMQKLKKIIKDFNCDIIHAHMFHAIMIVRFLSIYSENIVISHAHNTSYGGFMRGFLYRVTDSFSNLNVNVSFEATDIFIKKKIFKKEKTITLLNGVDTQKHYKCEKKRIIKREKFGFQNNDIVLINIASLTEQKDHKNLLRSYQYALEKGLSKSHLFIVGDGYLRSEIEQEIQKMELTSSVTLLGIRDDISDLLNMADIFILSSAWEGLPLVIAEAMACEKLVLSTDCGGVKEILDDDYFLVEINNSVALGENILKFSQKSTKYLEEIGGGNREKILKKYSLDSMAESWSQIYIDFLKTNK